MEIFYAILTIWAAFRLCTKHWYAGICWIIFLIFGSECGSWDLEQWVRSIIGTYIVAGFFRHAIEQPGKTAMLLGAGAVGTAVVLNKTQE